MKILISAGAKTQNIVDAINKKFNSGGVEFIVVEFIEDIDSIYQRGDYFDRVILIEQSWNHDYEDDNEGILRNRINDFVTKSVARELVGVSYVFLTQDIDVAAQVYEEILPIQPSSVVLVKQPRYSVTFFASLVTGEIDKMHREYVYIPEIEDEIEVEKEKEEVEDSEPKINYSPNYSSNIDDDLAVFDEYNGNKMEDGLNRDTDFNFNRDELSKNLFDDDEFDVSGSSFDEFDEISTGNSKFDTYDEGNEGNAVYGSGFEGDNGFNTDSDDNFEGFDDNFEGFDDSFEGFDDSFEGFDEGFDGFDEGFDGGESEDTHEVVDGFNDSFDVESSGFNDNFEGFDEGFEGFDEGASEDTHEVVDGFNDSFDENFENLGGNTPDGFENSFNDRFDKFEAQNKVKNTPEKIQSSKLDLGNNGPRSRDLPDYTDKTKVDSGFIQMPEKLSSGRLNDVYQHYSNPGDEYNNDDLYDDIGELNELTDYTGVNGDTMDYSKAGSEDTVAYHEASKDNGFNGFGYKDEANEQSGVNYSSGVDDFDSLGYEDNSNKGFSDDNYVESKKPGTTGHTEKATTKVNNKARREKKRIELSNAQLKATLDAFANRGNSIVITGCGGCGTSTIALNLANVINNLGYTVLLVDLDTKYKAQSYITKDNYDCIDPESASVMAAINSSSGINAHVGVIRPGFHLLTMGIASDSNPIEKLIHREKLTRFMNLAKTSHNFVIYDSPFETTVGFGKEITFMADNIVVVTDCSNWGITKTMISMANIEGNDDDMKETMFNKGQILFNRYRNINRVMGKKVKTAIDITKIMDTKVRELIGEDPGFYFQSMYICGMINDDTKFESGWYEAVQYSDTKDGGRIFLELLRNIILKQ